LLGVGEVLEITDDNVDRLGHHKRSFHIDHDEFLP